jgi:hypothetical protein
METLAKEASEDNSECRDTTPEHVGNLVMASFGAKDSGPVEYQPSMSGTNHALRHDYEHMQRTFSFAGCQELQDPFGGMKLVDYGHPGQP